MSQHRFSIDQQRTCLDGKPIQLRGLRLSNALLSEEATEQALENLEAYRSYGINSFSVFLMGNRFGNVKGYREDATLSPEHALRLERVLNAADDHGMVVLVGCLYWGDSGAKWSSWTQAEANKAVAETARWLREKDFRHTFLDPDNEAMAHANAGFDNRALVQAAKATAPDLVVAVNSHFQTAQETGADLPVHHSAPEDGMPYVETEGTMERYWNEWSNPHPEEWRQYDHIGEYTEAMRTTLLTNTFKHLDRGDGYFFASTWLQAAPPLGPNHNPGGMGTKSDPGIRWWLEAIREKFGSYEVS